MRVIRVRNVNDSLAEGIRLLIECGITSPSRAGDVTVAPEPVGTVYEIPTERVMFWPERDANPFFHIAESLWMVSGRNDLKFLQRFIRNFSNYSDDGLTLHAAYGHRWRRHWNELDQLSKIISLMKSNPNTRRGVIAMWDPASDLRETEEGADIPCNTHIYLRQMFGKRDEPNRLNLTVCCRSNDCILGATGANAVHFSFLQEYLATRLGLMVGNFYQFSNNYHAYRDNYLKVLAVKDRELKSDPYSTGEVTPYPLMTSAEEAAAWDADLADFFSLADAVIAGIDRSVVNPKWRTPFFRDVARPLWWAHVAYLRKNWTQALEILDECKATDWRRAAREWLERRRVKHGFGTTSHP